MHGKTKSERELESWKTRSQNIVHNFIEQMPNREHWKSNNNKKKLTKWQNSNSNITIRLAILSNKNQLQPKKKRDKNAYQIVAIVFVYCKSKQFIQMSKREVKQKELENKKNKRNSQRHQRRESIYTQERAEKKENFDTILTNR